MRSSRVILGLLLLPASGVLAQARPDSARTDTATLRPVTVTESRTPTTTGGASAVVIRTGELRASPAPLLEDALRESPFVHVRQNSRGELEISIRGSDARQAAVLMDGVPLSIGWDHRVDPSLVPLTGAQNLVIVRGLASLLNGPNTLGGTVEVSHDNAFGRLGTGRVWGGVGVDENAAYVATIGAGRQLDAAASGTVSLRAGLAHRRREGFALARGVPDATAARGLRTNSDLRETDVFATARWRGSTGRTAGLMLSGFDAERGVPPEEHLSAPRLWRYPSHRRMVAALSGATGTVSTPFGFASAEAGLGLNAGDVNIEMFRDRSYSSVVAAEHGSERTLSARGAFTHTLPLHARLRGAATLATVNYTETLPPDTGVRYRQDLVSAGAEVDVPLGLRTTVTAGMVHDAAATPLTGGRTGGDEYSSATGWRAGITHELASHWRLHASASRRSRFPALRELYSGALNRFVPNPALRPETLLGVEAGVTVDRSVGFIPDATLQVAAFHHSLRDAVARITLPPPDGRFVRVNRDRISSTGVELLAGVALGGGNDRARAVTITADAVLQDIRVSDALAGAASVRHAENTPERRGMLEVGVPMLRGTRAFANARYTGPQYCLHAEAGGEVRLGATTETSFALERRITVSRSGSVRSLRALLSLDNAGNLAIYDQCGLPQPGRTLRLMLAFQ